MHRGQTFTATQLIAAPPLLTSPYKAGLLVSSRESIFIKRLIPDKMQWPSISGKKRQQFVLMGIQGLW